MSIRVDVQFTNNPHLVFTPGRQICGEVLATTPKPTEVCSVHVELKGKLWLDVGYFIDALDPSIDITPPSGSPLSSEFRNEQTSDLNRNISSDHREVTMILTTLKSKPSDKFFWHPGLHKVPFVIDIPNESFVPAIADRRIRVEYGLRAYVTTPMPFISFFSWASKSPNLSFQLYTPLREQSPSVVTKLADTKVGEWDEASSKPQAVLKYAIGGDTAKQWHPFVVQMSCPDLVVTTADMPYYLSEGCRLVVTPTAELTTDVFVRKLDISLVTRVQIGRPEVRGALVFSTSILSEKNALMSISKHTPAHTGVDLTPLLSGAKLPTTTLPSVNCYPLLITNELHIDLKLRAHPNNLVKQVSSSTRLRVPLPIRH